MCCVCVCVCVCVYLNIYKYTFMRICVYIYIHINIHSCVFVCIHTHIYDLSRSEKGVEGAKRCAERCFQHTVANHIHSRSIYEHTHSKISWEGTQYLIGHRQQPLKICFFKFVLRVSDRTPGATPGRKTENPVTHMRRRIHDNDFLEKSTWVLTVQEKKG